MNYRVVILAVSFGVSIIASSCSPVATHLRYRTTADRAAIIAHSERTCSIQTLGILVSFKAPPGWPVLDCVDQPLDWHFVASSPDSKVSFGMRVVGFGGDLPILQQYQSYLEGIHRHNDDQVQMAPEAPLRLSDGREVVPYRYYSDYWKERLVVMIPEGGPTTIFEFDAPDLATLQSLRDTIREVIYSYACKHNPVPNQTMQPTAGPSVCAVLILYEHDL